MATKTDVAKAVAAMAAIHGRQLTEDAVDMILGDLSEYAPDAVLNALSACRKEVRGFPTIADIVGRIEASDGRPGVEEAWAMIPQDEATSVVWTSEMATAYGLAHPLIREGDQVGARMAFKEKYLAEVKTARDQRRPARWMLVRGNDKASIRAALQDAIDKGRLPQGSMSLYAPELVEPETLKALPPANIYPAPQPEEVHKYLAEIRDRIAKTPGGEA